ncbi:MAG: aminoacyl-histidine dipeptidase [Deltaproteobacteria bacterium]|nr:aminoacyl-histidine dipeptidase [Deltaproteobacteria bacterium]
MSNAIQGLKPELLWKYFAEIATIPHGSKNETAIAKYVVDKAKGFGLAVKQDKAGTVLVKLPGTKGLERKASVCLQGHLDMVCEKNSDKKHDFAKDPITLVRKDNVITADGTTLGADNGVAVAANLALMEDKGVEHGPLELLFTVDEETGLTGANNLEPGFVESKILLNLDSEEEGELTVGCAGGKDSVGTWKVDFEAAPAGTVGAQVIVKGLKGGHSGVDIHRGRGNALKILARALTAVTELGFRVTSLAGGSKRNAIPREAFAVGFCPKAKLDAATQAIVKLNEVIRGAYGSSDPEVQVLFETTGQKKGKVIKKAQVAKIVKTITALPHGVMRMSADIKDLVETSTNVAVIETGKKEVTLATSQRSSVASEILDMVYSVHTIFELGGAQVVHSAGYPGWKPNLSSQILKLAKQVYKDLYGKEPTVKAIHAGLECGIIGEKYPGMDMVSLGPTLEAVHSPDEKIYVDTVDKFWRYLLALLKRVD